MPPTQEAQFFLARKIGDGFDHWLHSLDELRHSSSKCSNSLLTHHAPSKSLMDITTTASPLLNRPESDFQVLSTAKFKFNSLPFQFIRASLVFLTGLSISFLLMFSSTSMGVPKAHADASAQSSTFIRNKNLLDYICGTITTMFYDPTGGSRFSDDLAWRSSIRNIDPMTFYSDAATNKKIDSIMKSLGDKYSYYSPPSTQSFKYRDGSTMYSPSVERDGLLLPSLGIELQDQLVEAYGAHRSASLYLKSVPVITAVLAQSPAEKAGLQIGDQVLAVDGYNLEHIEKALNFKKFPSLQSFSSTLFGDQ
eukprot:gene29857-39618_t